MTQKLKNCSTSTTTVPATTHSTGHFVYQSRQDIDSRSYRITTLLLRLRLIVIFGFFFFVRRTHPINFIWFQPRKLEISCEDCFFFNDVWASFSRVFENKRYILVSEIRNQQRSNALSILSINIELINTSLSYNLSKPNQQWMLTSLQKPPITTSSNIYQYHVPFLRLIKTIVEL